MNTLSGTVAAFDREVGLGIIATADTTSYTFHCIEIADGSRDIAVGTQVTFSLIGKLGRYEAARITPA
ncbi:MAG: cold shock domain-containing protein [Actinobacteria bacterium]|nr:cold shock domain-containing protein [Actinomycetota bacterium]